MTHPRKLLAVVVGILFIIGALYILSGNPYLNGVVYTVQRMNESNAIKAITEMMLQDDSNERTEIKTLKCADIVNRLPTSQNFQFSDTGEFRMKWNFIDRDAFRSGMVDKTILLFNSIETQGLDVHMVPVLLRVSSSFSRPNQNCILLSFANARVAYLEWTDNELQSFLDASTPGTAADWIINWDKRRRDTNRSRT